MSTPQDAVPAGGEVIAAGRAALGIELGSTRIKAAHVDERGRVLGAGVHGWENEYVDGNWTYALDAVWSGLQACVADLGRDVRERWGVPLRKVAGLGVSAMMHGYLAFDADGELLVPFRTWRNTYTGDAAGPLTSAFGRNIPLRWSVAHLLHAVLAGEEHVARIASLNTLAGYVHERLTGRRVLGVGDAAGMFPIDAATGDYDAGMLAAFDELDAVRGMPWRLGDLLPEVLTAGDDAGRLTDAGARLLDPTGTLQAGAVLAPPEGDAGTGMVATNAVRPRTGNVSAGTSAFAMVVLEEDLAEVREQIDLVTTPSGDPVAMIHTNNCTGDLDAWARMFARFAELVGGSVDIAEIYRLLFAEGMTGRADAGGLLAYNYLSGEHQTGVEAGAPLLARGPEADFSLANVMRCQLYSAFGALATGMEVLIDDLGVRIDALHAHGGIFRTAGVAQQVLADALRTPVSVGVDAGEGGAWGMAILAGYTAARRDAETRKLADYLDAQVFADSALITLAPDEEGSRGYASWLRRYRDGLELERRAGRVLAGHA